jgi:transposase
VTDVAGLKFSAGGQSIPWTRDSVNLYAFHVTVPPGAGAVEAAFDFISPPESGGFSSGSSATSQLAVLNWNQFLLYPQGVPSDQLRYQASLQVPNTWRYGTALPIARETGSSIDFQPASLTTLIAYLKGACHASYSTVRKFLRDVVRVTISRGELARILAKVSRALERPYEELLDALPDEARLNVDETGHKQNGQRQWTWCFRAALYTLFKIDPSRSGDVLIEVLGTEFNGVLGCDYFSAYRRYQREFGVLLQFCLAHLIRDVKYLTTLPDARDRAYGERLREALRRLFAVIHRREELSAQVFQSHLEVARTEVLRCGTQDVPETRASGNLAKRFAVHGASYFRFLTSPGVEPTNNLAEQAIRFVVLDRMMTQGTRSEAGNRWCERIWTVIATCVQQGRSVFAYLEAAVGAWFDGTEAPSLLPEGRVAAG